jgi:hypothetical protein
VKGRGSTDTAAVALRQINPGRIATATFARHGMARDNLPTFDMRRRIGLPGAHVVADRNAAAFPL